MFDAPLYLKFRYLVAGGHAHFSMFCNRNGWDYTFQKCGEFVMDAKDVSDFQKLFDSKPNVSVQNVDDEN